MSYEAEEYENQLVRANVQTAMKKALSAPVSVGVPALLMRKGDVPAKKDEPQK